MSIAYDIKSEKWLSIWKLNPLANPDYYETLFKYFKSLCVSMNERQLIAELDEMIKEQIEEPMGSKIQLILYTYKNLPSLNSVTKSRNMDYPNEYVTKLELKRMLDKIETWIFDRLTEFEPRIRFRDSQKIM
jgi:hypothetical protein